MEKRYENKTAEAGVQKLWQEAGTYHFDTSSDAKEVFSIDTPPPTVSGKLHIGHIFSYTQTDLIARFKRMQGYNVFYPMGYDDNGLPTELFVEKKNKVRGKQLGRTEFIKLCLTETAEAQKLFRSIWQRMGLSIDWRHDYSTIEPRVRALSQRSFIKLYEKGFVYRKHEPALYCTTCQTTIAQSLLESVEKPSTFNTITFKAVDGTDVKIATTRPELLASCVAVFYHPDDSRYQHLNHTKLTTPIFDKEVPVMPDHAVDPEKGTGIVMCCTFGDQTDITWYKKYDLPFIPSVGLDGRWTDNTGPLAGLKVHDARAKILELLNNAGALLEQKEISHHVHVDERCKREIFYVVLTQWFVEILKNKQAFLDRADEIEWKPVHMKSRYRDWVENLSWDWCISRQRFFGVPFPVWHCVDCKAVLLAPLESLPIDPQETSYPGGSCDQCQSTNLTPETDVMDTWNTSALTPEINAHWPDNKPITGPMSMRPQAHDIIRTWAFDTIVKSHYHHNRVPWKEIVISGHALAGKGDKFSKSKGNALTDPLVLLDTYSADAIRYWAASGKLGTDILFSEEQLKIGRRLLTKLWNAFRFTGEHMKLSSSPLNPTDPLNRWILHKTNDALKRYVHDFEAYEYHHALERVERLFWHDLCDNYLELVKQRLFNPEEYDASLIKETGETLAIVGEQILKMFAPIMPHITETIYQALYVAGEPHCSLHQQRFDLQALEKHQYPDDVETIKVLLTLVSEVRRLKSEHQLSLKTPLLTLVISTESEEEHAAVEQVKSILAGVSHAHTISLSKENVPSSLTLDGDQWNMSIALEKNKQS